MALGALAPTFLFAPLLAWPLCTLSGPGPGRPLFGPSPVDGLAVALSGRDRLSGTGESDRDAALGATETGRDVSDPADLGATDAARAVTEPLALGATDGRVPDDLREAGAMEAERWLGVPFVAPKLTVLATAPFTASDACLLGAD